MPEVWQEQPFQNSSNFGAARQETVREIDILRSREYNLLAILLGRAPTPDVLSRVSQLEGDSSPLGSAHSALARAAAAAEESALQREFFDLFVGVGRGEILPYASYYMTGFLYERPLARIREDLDAIGICRVEQQREPEDHIAILLESMAALSSGIFETEPGADRRFFARHLKPWAGHFFADLEKARSARFYRAVAALGRMFIAIEGEAFRLVS